MEKAKEKKVLPPNGGYPMHTPEQFKDLYYTYIHNAEDRKMIEEAYEFAKKKHEGQFRKSGEPFFQHPLEVAYIIGELNGGPVTIASALLHDVVEDTDATVEELAEKFGDEVAKIVDSLTKIQRLKLSHRSEDEFVYEDHRKIFLGMAKDVRVILVKLADRLHNMRTVDSLSPERQRALAKETLEVFAPIAHRLGIYRIQSELQDLSLRVLEPKIYQKIVKLVNERTKNRKSNLEDFKKRIADILFKDKIPFRMESRVKSIYSIYRKMYEKGHNFADIYDVLAIRIITNTEQNCYAILGHVHQLYTPIPGRFKDYIAVPKPNMYQSLHTSIVAGDGLTYEVQIRTEEMDQIAEEGIAAHWRYKEGSHYNAREEQKEIEERLHWFRDFVSMSDTNQSAPAKEYMDTLTQDVFEANVYVFTPLGKVIDLPAGSTPLDFAYKIHTKVGDSCVGALINGVGVPLNTALKTGDICEIRTAKNAPGPNESWLNIAKTSSAKGHIRRALQKKDAEIMKAEKVKAGKQACTDSFKTQGVEEAEMERMLSEKRVLDEYHAESLEDLYVMMSNKNPTPGAVIQFLGVRKKADPAELVKKYASSGSKSQAGDSNPIEVPGGVTNLAISLANCCNPIPGDDVIGYISKGKGIVVHRVNCPNIARLSKRLIPVYWKQDLGVSTYPVDLEITASDRNNLLADIISCLGAKNCPCQDLRAHLVTETMNTVVNVTIRVTDSHLLEDVIASVSGVRGVFKVTRVIH